MPSPPPGPAAALRPERGKQARQDYRHGYGQLLYSHMVWPMLAVASLGGAGAMIVTPDLKGIWIVITLLTMAGGFLAVPYAVALGGAAFISVVPLLITLESVNTLSGEVFLVFALLPFSSLWLSAARAQQVRATRLHMLMRIPHVRAAMDVSDWSLLPRPRAIDRRLRALLNECHDSAVPDPALLFRISFPEVKQAADLLGSTQLQQSILDLSDELRIVLRTGDLLAEDIDGHGVLFILAFHNPRAEDSVSAIVRRIRPALNGSGFSVKLQYGCFPADGTQLHAMQWRDVE